MDVNKEYMLLKFASGDKAPRLLSAVHNMTKKAGTIGDVASSLAYGAVPYVGPLATSIGATAGSLDNAATDKTEEDFDNNAELSLIPGVGNYRLERRVKKQMTDDEGSAPHYMSTMLGPTTSTLLSALAGASVGAPVGALLGSAKDKAGEGAGGGLIAGAALGGGVALLAHLIGAARAAITPRRTKEEQREYANSSVADEYLFPGVATYNRWKAIGRSIGDSKERKEKDKKKETKTASLDKQALENVDNYHAKRMRSAGASTASINNYKQQRHTVQPGWNPFDWLFIKNYLMADNRMEATRNTYMDYLVNRRSKQAK